MLNIRRREVARLGDRMKASHSKSYGTLSTAAAMVVMGVALQACELTDQAKQAINNALTVESQGGGTVDPPDTQPSCFNQRLVQPEEQIASDVDILFVTDTSGSLDQERAAIADGIDAFVAELPAQTSYRVGVMLAHGDNSTWSGKLYRRSSSNAYVLNSDTMTSAQIRTQLRNNLTGSATDWSTDGGEAGLYSLSYGLTGPRLQSIKQQGFLRDEAALAVVFISDENDICARYPAGVQRVFDPEYLELPAFTQYCGNVTHESTVNLVKSVKGDKPVLISGIVYSDRDHVPSGGENEYGWGYMDAIQYALGIAVNMANGHFDQGLASIGQLVSRSLTLITEITLARPEIDPASIHVYVDGVESTFQYQSLTNVVRLLQPGHAQSIVDVNYCLVPAGGGTGGGCTGVGCGGGIGV